MRDAHKAGASDLQKDILVKATGIALRGHSRCRHVTSINSSMAVSTDHAITCQPVLLCCMWYSMEWGRGNYGASKDAH
ncbi:Hypothetical protein SMAX5B_020923 [Scophthalmus maximus]|uniref:Uncharacterized protein n=1 Tax=Scophthalmus maximus TaxID=52904 RepID=A0A2U9CQU0_SCOMX|nr:Hypothetical protein SMAX5B_020923 [Scophthalmus maximus]